MRSVGLHLRCGQNFLPVVERAHHLNLKIFQCFFINQKTQTYIPVGKTEEKEFLEKFRSFFSALYLHGSYWINLATLKKTAHRVFYREFEQAKRLQFTHMIVHPGFATGGSNKYDGIEALARALNQILKTDHGIQLVLENTAHAGRSVGGDLQDFVTLLEKLDFPDRISFCIDTAHAYSFGYDLADIKKHDDFVKDLDSCLGLSRIALIHLNDTKEKLGSKIDKHAIIGHGNIGLDALQQFILHPQLKHINVILELPELPEDKEKEMLLLVQSWK